MSDDLTPYPKGHTLDRKRFVLGEMIAGSPLWGRSNGEQLRPTRRPVIISLRSLIYSPELDARLRFDAPGVAPLLFIGPPDGYRPSRRKDMPWRDVAVIEARPDGADLGSAGRLSPSEAVLAGLGLCETILACAAVGRGIRGVRPETVYVAGEPGHRRFAGVAPRSFAFLGFGDHHATFSNDTYMAPEEDEVPHTPHSDGFSTALVLWFGLLGEHPYGTRGYPEQMDNMWKDVRRPFTGPPELGRILERVLVSDVEKRLKVDEMRDELLRLTGAWSLDPPAFPPPGLAEG
jgi:hypothetical protein